MFCFQHLHLSGLCWERDRPPSSSGPCIGSKLLSIVIPSSSAPGLALQILCLAVYEHKSLYNQASTTGRSCHVFLERPVCFVLCLGMVCESMKECNNQGQVEDVSCESAKQILSTAFRYDHDCIITIMLEHTAYADQCKSGNKSLPWQVSPTAVSVIDALHWIKGRGTLSRNKNRNQSRHSYRSCFDKVLIAHTSSSHLTDPASNHLLEKETMHEDLVGQHRLLQGGRT